MILASKLRLVFGVFSFVVGIYHLVFGRIVPYDVFKNYYSNKLVIKLLHHQTNV